MGAKWFACPDGNQIEIEKCLSKKGCRMGRRCATLAYLRLISDERKYEGITPSMAGNGPRLIYLKATTDYAINPDGRAFAVLGVGIHGKLGIDAYTNNILTEESLSDKESAGTPDCLEEDEYNQGSYILTDYKSFGSFKVMMILGMYKEDVEVQDEEGNPKHYKSGKKKGQIKTRQEIKQNSSKADILAESYQVNRYRMFFEKEGFPVSKMQLQIIVRDGGLQSAFMRGIYQRKMLVDIPRMPDKKVLDYYHRNLEKEIGWAFMNRWARPCNKWESWQGRRCKGFCEVAEACEEMSKQFE